MKKVILGILLLVGLACADGTPQRHQPNSRIKLDACLWVGDRQVAWVVFVDGQPMGLIVNNTSFQACPLSPRQGWAEKQ